MNWLCMCNPPVIIITFTNSYPDHPLTPSPNIERRHFYHNPSSPFSTIWFPFSIIQYFSDTKDLKAIHTGLAREWQSIGVSFLILLLSSLCFLLKQENQSKYGLPWKLNLIYGKACDLGKWPPKGKVWLRAGSAFTEETMPARFRESLRSYFLLSYQKWGAMGSSSIDSSFGLDKTHFEENSNQQLSWYGQGMPDMGMEVN